MTKQLYLTGIILMIALASCTDNTQADTILFNGKIVTVDESFTIAQAIAIKGDRIKKTSSDSEVIRLSGPNTQKIDLKGKTALSHKG